LTSEINITDLAAKERQMVTETGATVTAEEAARILGVTRQTLYSYVSRGIVVKQHPSTGSASVFSRAAITALAADRRRGRRPSDVARASLDWGLPVLETQISLVESGRLFYRGHDVLDLAKSATIEEVAALLWQHPAVPDPPAVQIHAAPAGSEPGDVLARFTRSTRGLYAPSWQHDEDRIVQGCSALLRTMAGAVLGVASLHDPIVDEIAQQWNLDEGAADLLRRALVLSADHELNASTFTVRCIASTGADLPASLAGGIAALSGSKHGGATALIGDFLDTVTHPADAERVILRALSHGLPVPGFGHALYPGGDPRALALLDALGDVDPVVVAVRTRAAEIAGLLPSVDFALVALCRSLGLPTSAAFALFAIGRSCGWIAHALEQRSDPGLIRPRARYTGRRPDRTPLTTQPGANATAGSAGRSGWSDS
jgi:citrate synthase